MSARNETSAHPQEAPLLELLHEALQANPTTLNGAIRGEDYIPMITEELPQDSALYELDIAEQEKLLCFAARAAYTFNKHQAAQSPFWENTARVQLVEAVARESLRLRTAGWGGKVAVSLAFYHPSDAMIALRDEYLAEHGTVLVPSRIVKFMDASRSNPRKVLDLVIAAFKHTRQNERILHCSDTELFKNLSISAIKKGDVTIQPKKPALPEMPIEDSVIGMDYIYASASADRKSTQRSTGNVSLVAYMTRVVETARQASPAIQQLEPAEFKDFLQIVGWYADHSGYGAVNVPQYVLELATKYANNVAELQKLGMNRNDALRNATYHDATYYENVAKEARDSGLPSDNFIRVFVKRHPIDCREKLEDLKSAYHYLCRELPDIHPGNRVMMAMRGMKYDIAQEVEQFHQAIKDATVIFGSQVSPNAIETLCAVSPNHYMERLVTYAAAHPFKDTEEY